MIDFYGLWNFEMLERSLQDAKPLERKERLCQYSNQHLYNVTSSDRSIFPLNCIDLCNSIMILFQRVKLFDDD